MRIVVLAKAGTGKTTMVAKIAYDWKHAVEGSPLKDIPLLFVITMRRLKKDTSLGDAILFQLLQSMDGISGEELEKFIAAHEDKCMLVLDGYDEYVGKICTKSSQDPHLCSSVIDVMCNRKLRKCRTLVTSRFYRETDFNKPKFAFVKMTVEGFSDANIAEYVTQFFKEEPQMGKGLHEFLQINPLITELIHVPLFCVMLCDLWQQKSLEDVNTKTGLFDQVNLFLWHHSRRSDDGDDGDVDDDDALDDDDSDSRLDELVIHLGRIAFESLLEDRKKIVFSESDFKDVKDELEMGRKMGLVSKRTVTARQIKRGAPPSTTEIQFYHKLAQEHCASKYLAQLTSEPSALEDALKRMGGKEGVLVYENLLRFTCGESAAACAKVLQHIHGQEWLLPPDVNFLFRVTLDLLHECQEVTSEVTSELETIFNRGYLCLHGLPSQVIRALHKLPVTVRNKIRLARVQSMELPDEVIKDFAEIVKQFGGLVHFGFRGVQMAESSMEKMVTATRHAKEDQDPVMQDDVKRDFYCTHFGR
ncbi:NLR family CARD domain-containing protein 4-like [Diadema antillarum]|uniref:NLR family CARD domain-containing protein 4-like n=1 Tax=Diadema antillarum TaxID=105358 RepID=UPI003A83917C